ncbi:hypothetical protein DLM45_09815 [Hyphomicrobium methylovorum]|uniref:hypothetical protein n=1 Tax=Hyphomicrobium methylovorum TaxID=84 RepID=UPI0015E74E6B|nr:hypothetical protein [Hyphomicrobium methylovorum]MBA2126515.1 hypothetical protein [Hyphomicrobium methylovorum]
MNDPAYAKSMMLLLAGIAVATLTVIFVAPSFYQTSTSETAAPQKEASAASPAAAKPSMTCWFHDFTRATIVVRFDFDVAVPKDAPPRFMQTAQAERDGTEKIFEADDRPNWQYSLDEDDAPVITSPDGATRIVLYGLDLNAKKAVFLETGLRSNEYRNLGGRCRQANLGGASDLSP